MAQQQRYERFRARLRAQEPQTQDELEAPESAEQQAAAGFLQESAGYQNPAQPQANEDVQNDRDYGSRFPSAPAFESDSSYAEQRSQGQAQMSDDDMSEQPQPQPSARQQFQQLQRRTQQAQPAFFQQRVRERAPGPAKAAKAAATNLFKDKNDNKNKKRPPAAIPIPVRPIIEAPAIAAAAAEVEDTFVPQMLPSPVPTNYMEDQPVIQDPAIFDPLKPITPLCPLGRCAEAATPAPAFAVDDNSELAKFAKAMEILHLGIDQKKRSILKEQDWVGQVTALIQTYSNKISSVKKNMEVEKRDMRGLLYQKRDLKKEQKTRLLKEQLKSSMDELTFIQNALGQVQTKEGEFNKTKEDLADKIREIQQTLRRMQKGDDTSVKLPDTPKDWQAQAMGLSNQARAQ